MCNVQGEEIEEVNERLLVLRRGEVESLVGGLRIPWRRCRTDGQGFFRAATLFLDPRDSGPLSRTQPCPNSLVERKQYVGWMMMTMVMVKRSVRIHS